MSVTCILHAASDGVIRQLLEEPPRIHDYLYPRRRPRGSWWARSFGKPQQPYPGFRTYAHDYGDLGKTWQVLHFALTGTKGEYPLPAGFIKSGGESIGDEDVGYRPARACV